MTDKTTETKPKSKPVNKGGRPKRKKPAFTKEELTGITTEELLDKAKMKIVKGYTGLYFLQQKIKQGNKYALPRNLAGGWVNESELIGRLHYYLTTLEV